MGIKLIDFLAKKNAEAIKALAWPNRRKQIYSVADSVAIGYDGDLDEQRAKLTDLRLKLIAENNFERARGIYKEIVSLRCSIKDSESEVAAAIAEKVEYETMVEEEAE